MKNPIYKIKNLTYKKDSNTVLNIKNFDIHRGACYTISGGMASGKSLLLNVLSRNIADYKGDVFYDDLKLSSFSKKKISKDISIVSQEQKKPFFITVKK